MVQGQSSAQSPYKCKVFVLQQNIYKLFSKGSIFLCVKMIYWLLNWPRKKAEGDFLCPRVKEFIVVCLLSY